MTDINKIYNLNCLEGLKLLDDNSIDCCVTSPPYWGLRNYGTDFQIWGGNEECQHEFPDDEIRKLRTKPGENAQCGNTLKEVAGRTINNGAICIKCGAWRGQLGLEPTPEMYVSHIVEIFKEVRRALKPEGTLWLNLGDSYAGGGRNSGNSKPHPKGYKGLEYLGDTVKGKVPAGMKPKDLVGIPWMVAFALRTDGWYLRSDIIWNKPNCMPESVTDRPTKAHEYMFLLSKNQYYYYDNEAIKEPIAESTVNRGPVSFGGEKGRNYKPEKGDPNFRNGSEQWGRTFDYTESCKNGRNKRTVWSIPTKPFKGAHFAVFPPKLIEPCILAGCPIDGIVLDPFMGSGTSAMVAVQNHRNYIGYEMNQDYIDIASKRIEEQQAQVRLCF
jgi:DNA modification methylase